MKRLNNEAILKAIGKERYERFTIAEVVQATLEYMMEWGLETCPHTKEYELPKFKRACSYCWVGVTATNRKMWFEAVWELEKIKAKVKYISLEPLLDWKYDMQLDTHFIDHCRFFAERCRKAGINWLIIGAQTKPYKPPKIEWVREIVEAADKAGIPVFLKDNLWELFINIPHEDIFWEDMAHLRQEIPIV